MATAASAISGSGATMKLPNQSFQKLPKRSSQSSQSAEAGPSGSPRGSTSIGSSTSIKLEEAAGDLHSHDQLMEPLNDEHAQLLASFASAQALQHSSSMQMAGQLAENGFFDALGQGSSVMSKHCKGRYKRMQRSTSQDSQSICRPWK